MASLRVGLLAFLAFFGQVLGLVGKECARPPRKRNVTLGVVSKDFKLFVTWQPAGDSSEVSYTVKRWDPFTNCWSTTHCVDISATSCDITCVYPKPSNRFLVKVESLERTGRTSERGHSEFIDYAMLVEPAPPVLQVRQAERVLVVNTTFTYPSCVKDFFQDLSYDLEFWEHGTKPKKLYNLMEEVAKINRTVFSGGDGCFRAQVFLPASGKRSNFSEPVCVQLLQDKEASWRLIVLLLLLLLLLPAVGATIYCSWYKNATAKFKTPHALDFSSYKGPPRFLEVGERERIKADDLVCEKVPVVSEIRRRAAPQINSPLTPSVFLAEEEEGEEEEEDDNDDDDSGSPIPYTEVRSQKKGMNCQGVGMCQKALHLSSKSESSQSDGGGCSPDVMVSKPFVPTELVTGEFTSDSQGTSLSGSSSAEEPLACSVGCPATRGGPEDMSGDLDFSVQLSTLIQGHDVSFPTETRFRAATDFPEGSWGNVEDSQMPLLRKQGNQDTHGLLLEESTKEERGFENASSSGGGRLMKEILLWKTSSIEGLESCSLGGNRNSEEGSIPGPKFCGYLPKHTHYISKT